MDEPTICWYCKHAVPSYDEKLQQYTRGCEWSIYKQPVPGWEAEARVFSDKCISERCRYSYEIKSCPKFEKG